ncbi:histidine kinase N-terminal 7TM domain-containing protein [Natrinema marinum]|uniref:histidine kinase N-terminal 7TM domain-containing protein n=1 Tax=Natrinema marinum TaxID=2961598 RepID=UPI0020C83AE0|nr:histidine kinase N-terminal 7TM domain-containing protein [Natrinema marinum]
MVAGTGVDPIQVVYAVVVFNSAVLAGVLWRYRDRPGAVPLLSHVLAAGVWAGAILALTVVESGLLALELLALLFLAVGFTVMTLLVFTLEYTGRERFITRSTLLALSIEPVLVAVFAAVNPGNLFLRTYTPVEWGIAFWVHTAYSYVLLTVATVSILEFLYRSRSLYRGQSAALLGATVVGWGANVVYVLGLVDVDTSPIGFLVAGILFAIAIVRYRLTDIVPVARERVLDTVSDAVFVVDEQGRLIDVNPAARAFLAETDSSPIGTDIESLLADRPGLVDEFWELTQRPETRERELELDGSHYHVRTTPIEDSLDRHVGWLFIVRDITDRKRHETQLERQNKRLERFADVVSHDLRNPLSVADGYVDLALETGDVSHLEKVQRSHDRMDAIIDDVLALAREGKSVSKTEPVELGAVAKQAWENVATGSNVLSIDSSAVVLADRARLLRLLENLFRNAVEHGSTSPPSHAREDSVEHGRPTDGAGGSEETTEADPQLTVSVGVLGGNSVYGFYVADDGRGLPDDEKIFEQGYTTNEDGTGFGLSIVEQIATAHNWTIDATESEDGGARFELTGVETVDADDRVQASS